MNFINISETNKKLVNSTDAYQTPITNKYVSFIIDNAYLPEYNSNNAFPNEGLCVKEELSTVSKEDESIVVKYLLEVMRKHGIITDKEYHAVLYNL